MKKKEFEVGMDELYGGMTNKRNIEPKYNVMEASCGIIQEFRSIRLERNFFSILMKTGGILIIKVGVREENKSSINGRIELG